MSRIDAETALGRQDSVSRGRPGENRIEMTVLVLLSISALFAGLLYRMASGRRANKNYWAVMGFFFGPFAIPFLYFSKKQSRGERK
jgi:hypothetical protein